MGWKKILFVVAVLSSLVGAEGPMIPRAVLAPARPCRTCGEEEGGSTQVSVSFLFWQAKIWGFEFASKSFLGNTAGAASQTFEQKLFVPDFSWRPGVKTSLSYNLPYDGWDVWGGYMYYHNEFTSLKKHFDSQTSPPGFGVVPLWTYPFVQITGGNSGNPLRYQNASANGSLYVNAIDAELGRSFFPVQSLPMRFKIGAKGAWLHHLYHVNYGGGTTIVATDPFSATSASMQFVSSEFSVSTDQWGLGPRVGLESKWNVWRGFNLLGNGAFSLLCSFFDLHSEYRDVLVQPTSNLSTMSMDDKFQEITPVCEAMLGLNWGTCFRRHFYFAFTIGYEWQYWWSINHARRNYVQTLPGETFDMRGDLQMQGLNAMVNVDF